MGNIWELNTGSFYTVNYNNFVCDCKDTEISAVHEPNIFPRNLFHPIFITPNSNIQRLFFKANLFQSQNNLFLLSIAEAGRGGNMIL